MLTVRVSDRRTVHARKLAAGNAQRYHRSVNEGAGMFLLLMDRDRRNPRRGGAGAT
jgi:hypothetical protein